MLSYCVLSVLECSNLRASGSIDTDRMCSVLLNSTDYFVCKKFHLLELSSYYVVITPYIYLPFYFGMSRVFYAFI